jgi:hypothetical protein
MTESTPVHQLHPATITEDALTLLIREGARAVLAEAISAEVDEHIELFVRWSTRTATGESSATATSRSA